MRSGEGKWSHTIMMDGVAQEVYAKAFPLTRAVRIADEFFKSGLPISRVGGWVSDADESEFVDVDELVEFHLNEAFSALFKAVKGEAAHSDDVVVRVDGELFLELSYGYSGGVGGGIKPII